MVNVNVNVIVLVIKIILSCLVQETSAATPSLLATSVGGTRLRYCLAMGPGPAYLTLRGRKGQARQVR